MQRGWAVSYLTPTDALYIEAQLINAAESRKSVW